MSEFRLVPFTSQHSESMLALHRSAMDGFDTGINSHDEEADLRAVDEIYLLNGGEFLIGLLDETVIAMGGFKPLSDTTAELKRMRIRSDLQGKGYGAQLLRELEARALKRGFCELCLETAKARPLTLAFYQKHDYEKIGEGFYGAVQTVKFAKQLSK